MSGKNNDIEDIVEEYRSHSMEYMEYQIGIIRSNYEVIEILEREGLLGKGAHRASTYLNINVQEHEVYKLVQLRKLFGRLQNKSTESTWTGDQIQVTLQVKDRDGFYITYYKKFVPGGKCKIVDDVRVEKRLVCET